jgi:hypothetical protein
LKKKRPPNYYRQEYQQMLEPSTLQQQQQQQQQLNGQNDEATPIQMRSDEQTLHNEQNVNEPNVLLFSCEKPTGISCDQWVHSTMKHKILMNNINDDDDRSSSKQSTNDDDELESDGKTLTQFDIS